MRFPADLKKKAEAFHTQLVEAVAENDDDMMHKYLEGEAISDEEMRASLRKATIALKLFPVVIGSAFKNKGVQPLLDAVVDYLPSPARYSRDDGINPETGEQVVRRMPTRSPFSALVFKIMADPYVGQLTFVRIYSGQFKSGESVMNSRTQRIRARRPFDEDARQQARRHSGDSGGRDLRDRRHEERHHRRHDLRREESDHSRIDGVCGSGHSRRGRAENPGRSGQDGHGARQAGTGRSFVQGFHRSRHRTDDHRRHGRASSGNHRRPHEARVQSRSERRQAAGCVSRDDPQARRKRKEIHETDGRPRPVRSRRRFEIEPAPGKGYEFEDKIIGGTIPKEFIKPIDQGMQDAMEARISGRLSDGRYQGDALVGSYHEVDSDERSFKIAGSMAFQDAAQKANPVLLEPIMAVEVVTPEEYMGTVKGDLRSRRGQIERWSTALVRR